MNHQKNKILIVDDDEKEAGLIKTSLIKGGFDPGNVVMTAQTWEALILMENYHNEIVVLVSDYQLEDHNFGDELIKKVKGLYPDIHSILVSRALVQSKAKEVGAAFCFKSDLDILPHLVKKCFR